MDKLHEISNTDSKFDRYINLKPPPGKKYWPGSESHEPYVNIDHFNVVGDRIIQCVQDTKNKK
tara:strand:- start:1444 stop:1632 length:189 start_codon:yes stop_codon:yes gene_type:complete